MVVKDTVKPMDCAFTSQKHTRRPQVFDRGRYAMSAAARVQSRFAAVAVKSRAEVILLASAIILVVPLQFLQLGTLRIIEPPIRRETI